MNILKKASVLALTFAMLFTFSACGSGTDVGSQGEGQGSDGEIVWDCQFLDSSSHPMIILMREWSDQLYEETDGRLKVNIRVGGELPFTTSEYLDAVSNGSIQMAGCMVTAISSYLQAGGLTSVPFLVTDVESYAVTPFEVHKGAYELNDTSKPPYFFGYFHRIVTVDGDVEFCSGIKLIKLPGHSPGSQGILVQTPAGQCLITGDLYYDMNNVEQQIPTGVYTSLYDYYASFQKVAALGKDLILLPGHDAHVFQTVERLF